MLFSEGTRLGPYQITAPIGAGGMGEVYKAHDTRLDRTVAIKVLPPRSSATPGAAALRARGPDHRGLSHPHICPLFDVGHHDGADFLVMEYLEGETLAQRLAHGPAAGRAGHQIRARRLARRSRLRTPPASSTAT